MIRLGDIVVDEVTGFSGMATARIEYLTGCVQYKVQPMGLFEGKIVESEWLDAQRLDEVDFADAKALSNGPPGG